MVHDTIATFLKRCQTHLELADACSVHPTRYYLCVFQGLYDAYSKSLKMISFVQT